MRGITFIMLGLLALSAEAPAAENPAKVLTDTSANLSTAQWKVTSADWSKGGPAWSIELKTLHGGRQEGVQTIEVDNGAMRFTIVPTRGFEIWKAQAGRLRLAFHAPNKVSRPGMMTIAQMIFSRFALTQGMLPKR